MACLSNDRCIPAGQGRSGFSHSEYKHDAPASVLDPGTEPTRSHTRWRFVLVDCGSVASSKSATALPSASRRGLIGKRRCAGSFVIEAVISVLLLATASLAVVRLARSSVDLQLRADREMAAALTAQNVIRQLDALPSDPFPEQVAEIENAYGQQSGCDVSISLRPFDRDGVAGLHLRVDVAAGDQARVTLHDWRLDERRVASGESGEMLARVGEIGESASGESASGESGDGGQPMNESHLRCGRRSKRRICCQAFSLLEVVATLSVLLVVAVGATTMLGSITDIGLRYRHASEENAAVRRFADAFRGDVSDSVDVVAEDNRLRLLTGLSRARGGVPLGSLFETVTPLGAFGLQWGRAG